MNSDETPARPLRLKIEPKSKDDQSRLLDALDKLALEDASFAFEVDVESGETILSGQNELHLDLKIDRLKREFRLHVICGQPQVAYRETIARAASCRMTFKKQKYFAEVELEIEPLPRNSGNTFAYEIEETPGNTDYIAGVTKGVQSTLNNGVAIGFPMVDIAVNWTDGVHQADLSNALSFEMAARMALKEACTKAEIIILEPIMELDAIVPVESSSQILADLSGRRGKCLNQQIDGNNIKLKASAPLSLLFGFSGTLRTLTRGQGRYEMRFSHYAPLPRNMSPPDDNFPPAVGMRS